MMHYIEMGGWEFVPQTQARIEQIKARTSDEKEIQKVTVTVQDLECHLGQAPGKCQPPRSQMAVISKEPKS
jgi:hypothetical protein